MGKISESTSFKISDFIFRFRESSQRFVVEILTQNFAFNLSGTLFFIGLGCSLKWWYKDQLLTTLLKQNLPAFSQPQQKIGWETGEYLIGEQTRQFIRKKPNHFQCTFGAKENIFSASSFDAASHEAALSSKMFSAGKSIDLTSNKEPEVLHWSGLGASTSSMYSIASKMNQTSEQDKETSQPLFSRKKIAVPASCEAQGKEQQAESSFTPIFQALAKPCSFDESVDRLDVHSNSVVINFRSPRQKHAYQRFVGIFPSLHCDDTALLQNKERITPGTLSVSRLPYISDITATKFVQSKYTFWGPPKNWFKLSARGLCVLNENPRSNSFLHSGVEHKISKIGDAFLQKEAMPASCEAQGFPKKNAVPALQDFSKENTDKTKVRFRPFAPKVHGKLAPDAPQVQRSEVSASCKARVQEFLVQYTFGVKKLRRSLSPSSTELSHSSILNKAKAELRVIEKNPQVKSTLLDSSKIANQKLDRKSYPLELTQTMNGWQPPVTELILNSYLDEIPYKLETTLWATTRQLVCQADSSNSPLGGYNGEGKEWRRSFACTKKPIKNLYKGAKGSLPPLIKEKLQLIEIKQLLKNELEILVNSLPVIFVDQSSRSKSNSNSLQNGGVVAVTHALAKRAFVTSPMLHVHSCFARSGHVQMPSTKPYSAGVNVHGEATEAPLANCVNSFSLLNSLGITFNNLSHLKDPPVLLPTNQDASFWKWNMVTVARVHAAKKVGNLKKLMYLRFKNLHSLARQDNNNLVTDTTFRFDPNTMTWRILQQLNSGQSFERATAITQKPIRSAKRVHFVNQIILQQKHLDSYLSCTPIASKMNQTSEPGHAKQEGFPKENNMGDVTRVLRSSLLQSKSPSVRAKASKKVPSYSQRESKLRPAALHLRSIPLESLANINPVDTQITSTNKRVRLMSGYIYPDTQSASLMLNLYRWTYSAFPFGGTDEVLAPTSYAALHSLQPEFHKKGCTFSMHDARCTMHHAPCTMHDAPCTMHPFSFGKPSVQRFSEGKWVQRCKGANSTNVNNVLPLLAAQESLALQDTCTREADTCNIGDVTRVRFASASVRKRMISTHDWLLSSKMFREINRLVDKACLFKVCTSNAPTTIGRSVIDPPSCEELVMHGKEVFRRKTPPLPWNGLKFTPEKFEHHLGYYPGFLACSARQAATVMGSRNKIAQGHNLSEDLFHIYIDSSLNSEPQPRYGIINSVEGFPKENFEEENAAHAIDEKKQNLTQKNAIHEGYKETASKVFQRKILQKEPQLFDCSPRKTAYNGIVVQRNSFTKDFQFSKKSSSALRRHSVLGTLFFGPENPLTDRQSHFFGQRRLSTIDVNVFQRDYLRQLGKETLLQSNPKEFTYGASVERVKILSFSKAINSFLSKKRKYTYLLEEKDQWHLLFQEQLRTALEDTRKYPLLTTEESKDHGAGRIKVSAPLMMARFPKKSNCYKILAFSSGKPTCFTWPAPVPGSTAQRPFNMHQENRSGEVFLCTHFPSENLCTFAPKVHRASCIVHRASKIIGQSSPQLSDYAPHVSPFTETWNESVNSATYLQKNSFVFGNNNLSTFLGQRWLTQEPLNANSWLIISQWSFLVALLFWIEQTFLADIFPALFALEQLLLGTTGMKSDDRTHVTRVSKGEIPKFKDIAGIDGLLGELAELVLFLRGHKRRLWNKRSAFGVLLTGPPGTGKTFLVRALANEAKVPVLILSAGVLTANKTNNSKPSWSIRHAFRRAKQLAPCILFIDEIDALGRSRGNIVTDINEITSAMPGDVQAASLSKPPAGPHFFEMKTSAGLAKQTQYRANASLEQQLLSATERSASGFARVHQLHSTPSPRELASQGKSISAYNQIDRYSLCADTNWLINVLSPTMNGEALQPKGVGGGTKIPNIGDKNASYQPIQTKENIKRKFGPLTQLLVSMDGVSSLSGVLIIGATNRPESLDPALTRPGRFERIIRVEKPAEQKRIEILKLYSRNLGIQKPIPWSYLANRTRGLTAADLAVAMNYSSLNAILQGTMHTIETIEYGLDSIARFSNREVKQKQSGSFTNREK